MDPPFTPIAKVLLAEMDKAVGPFATLSSVPPLMVIFGAAEVAPKFASALMAKIPLLMVVPPEYVLTPVSAV